METYARYLTWSYVLLLVVMGIMIMTRKKINPQAVVTVQNVLPRVAISVVLVFFSYAIGAF